MPAYSKDRKQQREFRFYEWLLDVLERERSPKNAYWLDRSSQIFAIRWVNAKSSACSEDCWDLFKLWKEEGSRSWTKDRSEDARKRMKTNFRMNLRSQNFVELPKNKETRGKYPVRVFHFVGKTNRNATSDSATQKQSNSFPSISHGGANVTDESIQVPNNDLTRLIKGISMTEHEKPREFLPNLSNGLNSPESYTWSNNPTGTTPRMTQYPRKFLNKTPPEKYSSSNASLECLNSISQNFFEYHESTFQDIAPGSLALEQNSTIRGSQHSWLPSARETQDNFQPIFPLKEIDVESTANYLLNLETYPGSIQEILPHKQHNVTNSNPSFYPPESYDNKANYFLPLQLRNQNTSDGISRNAAYVQDTQALRHNFVSSPTDSGFIERLSTRSLSSVWSNEDTTAQAFDDTDLVWPLDELSDPVFD